jgi:hypothetical protein
MSSVTCILPTHLDYVEVLAQGPFLGIIDENGDFCILATSYMALVPVRNNSV